MQKSHLVWTKVITHFTVCIEVDGLEHDVKVIREDIPDMGGDFDYEYIFPSEFPQDKIEEAKTLIEEIDMGEVVQG